MSRERPEHPLDPVGPARRDPRLAFAAVAGDATAENDDPRGGVRSDY